MGYDLVLTWLVKEIRDIIYRLLVMPGAGYQIAVII
jgi:hypothetical protein